MRIPCDSRTALDKLDLRGAFESLRFPLPVIMFTELARERRSFTEMTMKSQPMSNAIREACLMNRILRLLPEIFLNPLFFLGEVLATCALPRPCLYLSHSYPEAGNYRRFACPHVRSAREDDRERDKRREMGTTNELL